MTLRIVTRGTLECVVVNTDTLEVKAVFYGSSCRKQANEYIDAFDERVERTRKRQLQRKYILTEERD